MPHYQFACPHCANHYRRYRPVDERDEPLVCEGCGGTCVRLLPTTFQFIGCREADKPENQLYTILTRGGGETEKMALYREDMKRMEESEAAVVPPAPYFGTEEILKTGIVEAARSGEEGISNWRKEWIDHDTTPDRSGEV